jgi:type VI secretion system protein ImpA
MIADSGARGVVDGCWTAATTIDKSRFVRGNRLVASGAMFSSEINTVLEPISADAPCGVDLEDGTKYDPAFAELERLAQGKPEQQIGSTVVPAEEPDWKLVRRKSVELLTRSKDLRVATQLTKSLLRTDGWSGFATGLAMLRSLVERYWDGLYPRLDPDDGNDPTMRVNVLMSIADNAILNAVRLTPLVVSRTLGRFSIKDLEVAAGEAFADSNGGPPTNPAPTTSSIDAAAMDCDLTALKDVTAAVQECLANVTGLETEVASRVDSAYAPSFAKLTALTRKAKTFLDAKLAQRMPVAESENGDAGAAGSNGAGAASWAGGIRSRDDVVRALDAIVGYYEKFEPSSPIPIFMARCKRLVMMGFVDIVRELVPDAISQVDVLRGRVE